MVYYVYMYHRKDGSPYYVGKGVGDRWNNPNHNCSIPPEGRVSFPIEGTSEDWALFMEMELIDLYGRLDDGTGVLENRTDGGENPPKAKKGQKNRVAAARTLWANMTPEQREDRGRKISETKKKAAHITAEHTRRRHAAGNYYTEEGKVAMKELGVRNKDRFGENLVCVETGQKWKSIREATKELGCSRNTIKNALRTNKVITQGKLKGLSFEYQPTQSKTGSA